MDDLEQLERVGYKKIEYTFIENQEENIYFSDRVKFMPSED